jgi:hypothetical protein
MSLPGVSRQHADWLGLVPNSGPFVSLPVLMRAFPQGLDARDPVQGKALRDAFEQAMVVANGRSAYVLWHRKRRGWRLSWADPNGAMHTVAEDDIRRVIPAPGRGSASPPPHPRA